MKATRAILDFAAADHRLPASVRADTVRLIADTLASGAAGAQSPEAQKLKYAVRALGTDPHARLLCGGEAPAASAAFFNGFAIHCLEWDAVHEGAVVHALSAVTAAVMAQAHDRGGIGEENVLAAVAVGVDIASGLGLAATGPMAFFRPATAGVIGAALAAARLTDIPTDRYADVMGLAYSFASGTMQAHVEASIALPLQIANAARAAITAVALVEGGMTGPHDVLEGPFGYSRLIEPLDLSRYTADLGKVWRISEVAIKPFPSGRASHGALGELEALHREGLRLGEVARIELYAPPLIERLVGRPYRADMSPAYARLCLAILAPLMLRDGVIDPDLFDAAALHTPELVGLAGAVVVRLDDNPDGNAMAPQRLVVTRRDGGVIERTIPVNLGSPASPMSAAQSAAKYALCRRLAGPAADPRIFDDPLSFMANS
ncbi:MmgE/PrpD family protein [Erythrobacter sp. BLCC-B19]|uniref:MmgE/PrpD family protein n=1 Tax=Erythrobacter sp. BLCC-B19 TaxID=3025315 RepID=UPI00235EFE2A|nr:MmgE/PrpD family protein [Erythrobacter sp. BLCC-B19]WDA41344.1 MmgE/PrpD family protein [Erythrobacter sp. BLCC-B19]